MPPHQRCWRDYECAPTAVREQTSKRSDQGTVGRPKLRTLMLASQDRKLVSQQHGFNVLGEVGLPPSKEQPQQGSEGKVSEGKEH